MIQNFHPFLFFHQMKLGDRNAASWSIALQALAALSQWRWPIWCRSSTCPWTMLTTLSRWKNPTSHPISTSWVSFWTLSAHWVWRVHVITAWHHQASSSTSPPRPTTTSSSWTPWSPREVCCHHSSSHWGFCGPPIGKAAKCFLFFPSSAVRHYWYSWSEATAAECGYWRAIAVWPKRSCCWLNEERQYKRQEANHLKCADTYYNHILL